MEFLNRFSPEVAFPVCLAVGVALWGASLLAVRRSPRSGDNLNTPARFFLVALRIAVGWHLTVEGLEKIKNPGWSSEGYLRESYGPFAERFRTIAGDRVLDRVVVDGEKLPPLLDREWSAYFDAFVGHYGLGIDQQKIADEKLSQRKADAATKLTTATWPVPIATTLTSPVVRDWTVPESVEHYRSLVAEVRRIETDRIPVEGKKAWELLKKAKSDANKERAELKKIADGLTAEMRKALDEVLTPEQKKAAAPLPPYAAPPVQISWDPRTWSTIEGADWIMKHGLLVAGACLIFGLFTRLAAFVAAGLVTLIFLAMMPLPNWPLPAQSEGNYLYVNKTLIEVLALMCLAFIPTGRWVGVDGILHVFNPFAWRSGAAEPEPEKPKVVVFPVRRPD